MKASEINALRQAETIEQVAAMVDCRAHEYNREEMAEHVKIHLKSQYAQRVLNGLPHLAALNHAKANVINANGGSVNQQAEFWRAADAAL